MGDAKSPKIFVDTSALFAAIWSEAGGGRAILKLGEAGTVQILCSSQVLSELDDAFREKAPELLSRLALLIDASQVEVTVTAPSAVRKQASNLVEYGPDAEIIASAIHAKVDYFVTLDKAHFLSNKKLEAAVHFSIGTPGQFLAWFRSNLSPPRSKK